MNSVDILFHISVAGKPGDLVETREGKMTYQQWCEAEVARIKRKSGWPVIVYTNPNTGEISVAHLRVKA